MTTVDLIKTVSANNALMAENTHKVFDAGKAQGGGGSIEDNPLYYMTLKGSQWEYAVFPEGFNLVAELKNAPTALSSTFSETKGLHSVKLICKESATIPFNRFARLSEIRVIDLTEFKPIPSIMDLFVYNNSNIVSILGKLNLSSCTNVTNAFGLAKSLEDIEFEEGTINLSITFESCSNLTAKSLKSIVLGLSPDVTGQSLSLPAYATVKTTYDDAVSGYGEGAWNSLVAGKPNWTFAYK